MAMIDYLRLMAAQRASDLILSTGAAPALKVEGETRALNHVALDAKTLSELIDSMLTEEQRKTYAVSHELNMTWAEPEIGRFRINFYRQRGEPAMAIRYIPNRIPTIAELNLPAALEKLVMLPSGLVLVVGASGSGKSTTFWPRACGRT